MQSERTFASESEVDSTVPDFVRIGPLLQQFEAARCNALALTQGYVFCGNAIIETVFCFFERVR
ncbi:hypothetical protein CDZ96_25905 [Mameliella alba]|nr:hypothetical protein CDZ96_25905 [Mameliella alba]